MVRAVAHPRQDGPLDSTVGQVVGSSSDARVDDLDVHAPRAQLGG